MSRTPNWKELDLQSQCGVCACYEPRIKNGLLKAHGVCTIRNNRYKMRTERCDKYIEIKGEK